jgi:hypothetical protein
MLSDPPTATLASCEGSVRGYVLFNYPVVALHTFCYATRSLRRFCSLEMTLGDPRTDPWRPSDRPLEAWSPLETLGPTLGVPWRPSDRPLETLGAPFETAMLEPRPNLGASLGPTLAQPRRSLGPRLLRGEAAPRLLRGSPYVRGSDRGSDRRRSLIVLRRMQVVSPAKRS